VINGAGVRLIAGGYVNNQAGGSISGNSLAVGVTGGTVVNYGAIQASATGGIAVQISGVGSTLVNGGAIIANYGTAVVLKGNNDLLSLAPGAVFYGAVTGNHHDQIELRAGTGTGTLFGLGSYVTGFNALTVDAGAVWEVSGDASSVNVTNDGTILVSDGVSLILHALGEDQGAQGVVAVGGGGSVELSGAVNTTETFIFTDAAGTALLTEPARFTATIVGFRRGDTIDLVGKAATKASFSNGSLRLSNQGTAVATLQLLGNYATREFKLTPDGNGGTDLKVSVTGGFVPFGPAAAAVSSGSSAVDPLSPEQATPFWVMRG
jgi:hypothetical protein